MHYYEMLKEELGRSTLERITILSGPALGTEIITRNGSTVLSNTSSIPSLEGLRVLEETITLLPHLILFGAGHVGKAVADTAALLHIPTTVCDDRVEMNTALRFPLSQRFTAPYETLLAREIPASNPYYLIFTHGHGYDKACLAYALKHESPYIGMIGSARKIKATYDSLRKEGFTDTDFARVHSPIGLDINAGTPEEIAIAIMGEIISVYATKHRITLSSPLLDILSSLKEEAVLCRIVAKEGSAPREEGAAMLVSAQEVIGTIGGGEIESCAIIDARKILKTQKNSLIHYTLSSGGKLGMICGGDEDILFTFLNEG